ncbi:MAG TPA: hypothetical protein VI197_32195 [Polyangiaceae bacterium]
MGASIQRMLTEAELEAAIERGARQLSPALASEYEAAGPGALDPLERHALLLGYFRHGPCANVDAVVLHLSALIGLRPECACLALGWVSRESHPMHHSRVAASWRSAVDKSSNTSALLNAFHFFELGDEDYAGRLLKRGLAASPSDSVWHSAAGSYYLRRGARNADRTQLLLAHAHYAEALSLSECEQDSALGLVAYSALKAGKPEDARQAALQAVAGRGPARGVNQHLGHTVLGMLACERGDLEQAASHLLASAADVPQSYLSTSGPRLELAQRLLVTGKSVPVEAFVAKLVSIWPCGAARLHAVLDVV